MLDRPARARISVSGIRSCHLMLRSFLRQVVWKWFSFLAWRWYTVHVSHAYSSVGSTVVLYHVYLQHRQTGTSALSLKQAYYIYCFKKNTTMSKSKCQSTHKCPTFTKELEFVILPNLPKTHRNAFPFHCCLSFAMSHQWLRFSSTQLVMTKRKRKSKGIALSVATKFL